MCYLGEHLPDYDQVDNDIYTYEDDDVPFTDYMWLIVDSIIVGMVTICKIVRKEHYSRIGSPGINEKGTPTKNHIIFIYDVNADDAFFL